MTSLQGTETAQLSSNKRIQPLNRPQRFVAECTVGKPESLLIMTILTTAFLTVAVRTARIIGNMALFYSGFRNRNNFSENYPQIWARALEVPPALSLAEKA